MCSEKRVANCRHAGRGRRQSAPGCCGRAPITSSLCLEAAYIFQAGPMNLRGENRERNWTQSAYLVFMDTAEKIVLNSHVDVRDSGKTMPQESNRTLIRSYLDLRITRAREEYDSVYSTITSEWHGTASGRFPRSVSIAASSSTIVCQPVAAGPRVLEGGQLIQSETQSDSWVIYIGTGSDCFDEKTTGHHVLRQSFAGFRCPMT